MGVLPHPSPHWMNRELNKQIRHKVSHFCFEVFQKAKIKTFFFKFPNSLSGLTFLCYSSCTQAATYRTCFLKTKKNAIPGKISSVMARLLLRK